MSYLAFDTSTQVLTVAIGDGERVIAELTTNIKKDHSSRLMPAIEVMMGEAGITPEELCGIIVGKGPGSYTGLRIGVSTAKSMAWALNIPAIGVSSLSLIARGGKHFGGLIVPLIDARRGQVFTGLYSMINNEWKTIEQDRIILMKEWLEKLKHTHVANNQNSSKKLMFIGVEIELYREMIEEVFSTEDFILCKMGSQYSRAGELLELGVPMISNHQHEDVKGLSPEYLRLAEAEHNWLINQKNIAQAKVQKMV